MTLRGLDSALHMPRHDILILTASTGAGHDSVAVALQEALRDLAPTIGARVLDPLHGGTHIGLLSPGRVYDAMAAHAPWLWGLCYRATNNGWACRTGMAAGTLVWARRLSSAIQAERPGLVVSVHPLCTRLAAGILRALPAAPPLHCVVTDLVTVHRCWASEAVDTFYVATSDARDALTAMGVPRERVQVTGLPLRAPFAQAPERPAEGAIPRVLLLGGGCPSRWAERVARALAAAPMPVHLVVVCGRNARLRRRLRRALGAGAAVLGWRDDVAALMRRSSVVITKGGPTTIAEALSQARPVLIPHALPGQEGGNVALVERSGSGRYMPDVDAVVRAVAAGPRAWPTGDTTQAAWWGGAARRVAQRLLAAYADRTAAPVDLRLRSGACQSQALSILDHLPPGKLIVNPISGERLVIRESGAQTGGALLSFDLFLPPGAHVPSRHAHPIQEEQFTVIAGQMRFRLGRLRRTILANPGDTVRIPPRTAHWFGNAGAGVAHARVEARPALRMEEMFESAASMGVARYVPGVRMPRLSDLALFLREFQREVAVPDVPASLVRAVLAPFAWLGRHRGHEVTSGTAR